MRIALDAMGGDHAPDEIVAGALQAAGELKGELILVGDEEKINALLPDELPQNIKVKHASQTIDMHEKPMDAIRKKKDSSLAVCARLVKEGEAEAMVSAGNTGACTAVSLLTWRQIKGLHRPAIACLFPSRKQEFLLLDAGASPDVNPEHLLEFALMGRSYAVKVMGRNNPKVHLLNIGEEPGKGNAFAKSAHDLMAGHDWFAGNIESKDIFKKSCDVVVCDAFVGNILLKTAEGVSEFLFEEIKSAVPKGPGRLLFLPIKKLLRPMMKKIDYAEHGGSPLLGLNGICIICHGRSSARAILNAIRQAARSVEAGLQDEIKHSIEEEFSESNA